jgi:hypothetical protein
LGFGVEGLGSGVEGLWLKWRERESARARARGREREKAKEKARKSAREIVGARVRSLSLSLGSVEA